MFEIHVANTDVTSGTIPISWCLDRETLSLIKEEAATTLANAGEVHQYFVVISIVPLNAEGKDESDRKEVRYVVPLSQAMAYIAFKYPGVNRIRAFIVSGEKLSNVRFVWTRPPWDNATHYNYGIIGENSLYDGVVGGLAFGGGTCLAKPLEVEVPAECFASEPSEWEKAWTTWLVADDRFKDQCDYRRRRLFAYSIQPFVFLFNWLGRLLITLIALLCGARSLSAKYLLHPLTYPVLHTFGQFDRGIIFIRKNPPADLADKIDRRTATGTEVLRAISYQGWPLLVSPPTLITCVIITLTHSWPIVGVIVGVLLTMFLVCLVIVSFPEIRHAIANVVDRVLIWLTAWTSPAEDELPEEALVCSEKKPVIQKSLKLRFDGFKAKVCKPFAG